MDLRRPGRAVLVVATAVPIFMVGAALEACSVAIAQAGSVAPYQLVWGPRVRAFVGDLVAIENRGATNRFYFVVARGWGRAEPVEWLDSSTDSCGYSASVGQRVEARVVVHRDGRRTFSIADLERGSAGGRLAQRWGRPRWVRDLDEAAREASRREVRQRIALGSADCLLPAQTMRFVVPDTARDYGLPDGALSEAEGRERGTLLWSPRSSPEQVNAILLLLPRVAGCWQRVRGEIRCRSDERCQRLTRCRNLLGEHARGSGDLLFQSAVDPQLCQGADLEFTVEYLPYPPYLAD